MTGTRIAVYFPHGNSLSSARPEAGGHLSSYVKTTIDIPESLYKKAKIRAVEQGQTLKQIVLTSLQRELEAPPMVGEPKTPYFANRKLVPEFARLEAEGAFKPKPGSRSIEEIINEIKADPSL